jgi:hypothetical protein
MAKLPQAVVLGQFWFGCERGPVDQAAQREAGAVEPLALLEVSHIEQFRIGLGEPGQHLWPVSPGREGGQGHLDVSRPAPGPFKIQQRHNLPVPDQDVSRGAVAVQHHIRVPADRDPRRDFGDTRGDRVQDVLVSEHRRARVLDEPAELAGRQGREGARRDGDRIGLGFRALGRGVPGQHRRGRPPGMQGLHDLRQLRYIGTQHGIRFAAPRMPQRASVHAPHNNPAHQPIKPIIQNGRAWHATGQHGQQLGLSHQAVNIAAITDLQHRLGGQEPRIVRSALHEYLIAGQPQASQLRDLAQAPPGDHFIPRPPRYAIHDRHHPAGQIVRPRETRDTLRVHHNHQAPVAQFAADRTVPHSGCQA